MFTGKQGQSPCMSTCGPDLQTHTTFTGKKTHTHLFQIVQTVRDLQTCMHVHMCTHTHIHTPTITMQLLAQTTEDTNTDKHTCAKFICQCTTFHHRSALSPSIHPFSQPSPPKKPTHPVPVSPIRLVYVRMTVFPAHTWPRPY